MVLLNVIKGDRLRLGFNQVVKEFMRLSEIATMAGCGLSRIKIRHCPYAIYDIACLRLDLISDLILLYF